ncbi:MAG TPA: hypothetical protein VG603_06645, partial [Chitinophagales bacterium]|nr:hypothetical protein [Chitinophagales bacterium]
LEQAITNIQKRLGNEQWKAAIDALHEKDFKRVAAIALYYYDKAYDKAIAMKEDRSITRFTFEDDNIDTIANTLLQESKKSYGSSN